MANELPRMMLKASNIELPAFIGTKYTATPENLALLQQSLGELDARKVVASEAKAKTNIQLGEIEKQLNKADLPWFNEYKKQIEDDINEQIEIGNYRNAFQVATERGSDVLKDTSVLNRIKNNSEYNEVLKQQKDRLSKKEISKSTFEWWQDNNPYTYNAITNDKGEEISYDKLELSTPYDDIDWDNEIVTSFKLVSPDEKSTSRGNKWATDKVSADNLEGRDKSGGYNSNYKYSRVKKEDIIRNFYDRVKSDKDFYNKISQEIQVRLYDLKKRKANLDPNSLTYDSDSKAIFDEEKLLYKNGSPVNKEIIDIYKYITYMVDNSAIVDNLAYDHIIDEYNSMSSDTTNSAKASRTDSNPGTDDHSGKYPKGTAVSGNNVQLKTNKK